MRTQGVTLNETDSGCRSASSPRDPYRAGQLKPRDLAAYIETTLAVADEDNEVVLTGQGAIWLYLKVAYALHGKARQSDL